MKNELILIKVPKTVINLTSWIFGLLGLLNSIFSLNLHLEVYMFCSIMIMVSYIKDVKEIELNNYELNLPEGEGLLQYRFLNKKLDAIMNFSRWFFVTAFIITFYFDLIINI